MKFDKDSYGRDRIDRIRHYFGDHIGEVDENGHIKKAGRTRTRKILAEANRIAKEREADEKKAQAKADIILRANKTPSRKHSGKHDQSNG